MIDFTSARITGTKINYYFVCKRKLWLFNRDISMEHTSENVGLGKLIHEQSYGREKKELSIDETIKIDFAGKDKVVHEVKKGKSMDEAHKFQMYYYLYYLKKKGVEGLEGCIHYPKLRKKEKVYLDEEKEGELKRVLGKMQGLIGKEEPPEVIDKRICKKCSYYELCYC